MRITLFDEEIKAAIVKHLSSNFTRTDFSETEISISKHDFQNRFFAELDVDIVNEVPETEETLIPGEIDTTKLLRHFQSIENQRLAAVENGKDDHLIGLYTGKLSGMFRTLDLLGIKVEGINGH